MLKTILTNWLIPAMVITFVLLATSLFVPGWAGVVAGVILFLILTVAILSVVQNQMKMYREKRISRSQMARNVLYDVVGILLAMLFASMIGRFATEIATQQIGQTLPGFAAGIVVSLLAGMSVGFLVKRTWFARQRSRS